MPIGVLSSYTAKIEPQFNKICLKRGGNGLKKRPAHLSIVERLGGFSCYQDTNNL